MTTEKVREQIAECREWATIERETGHAFAAYSLDSYADTMQAMLERIEELDAELAAMLARNVTQQARIEELEADNKALKKDRPDWAEYQRLINENAVLREVFNKACAVVVGSTIIFENTNHSRLRDAINATNVRLRELALAKLEDKNAQTQ